MKKSLLFIPLFALSNFLNAQIGPPPPQEKVAETNVDTVTQEGNGEDVSVPSDGGNGTVEEVHEIFTVVEQMPEFPGGAAEMMKYIQKNKHYPEIEKEAGITGRCFVKFIVEMDGSITNVEILKGVPGGAGCDKEAIRVIKSMPKWNIGKQNGRPVRVYFNVPVSFKL